MNEDMAEAEIREEIYLQVEREVRDKLAWFVETLLKSYSSKMPAEAQEIYRQAMADALKLINGDPVRHMTPPGPWE